MKYKFYYKKDWSNFEHYYKINEDGVGIHVNLTSPCINHFRVTNMTAYGEIGSEVTEKDFDKALNQALGLTLGVRPFKIV